MSSKIGNTLSVAIGAAFIGSLSLSQLAAASPAFQASDLASGYMLAAAGEGKCGEEDREEECAAGGALAAPSAGSCSRACDQHGSAEAAGPYVNRAAALTA